MGSVHSRDPSRRKISENQQYLRGRRHSWLGAALPRRTRRTSWRWTRPPLQMRRLCEVRSEVRRSWGAIVWTNCGFPTLLNSLTFLIFLFMKRIKTGLTVCNIWFSKWVLETIFDGFSRVFASLSNSVVKLIKATLFSRVFVFFDGFRHDFSLLSKTILRKAN